MAIVASYISPAMTGPENDGLNRRDAEFLFAQAHPPRSEKRGPLTLQLTKSG
jgi:hypothetical protein